MSRAPDPRRHLLGGEPPAVWISGRVAALLDRMALDALRRRERGADLEFDETLAAVHLAALAYREHYQQLPELPRAEERPLPQAAALSLSSHDLLTTDEVARRLGCGVRNVRDLHNRGRLAGHKVAGRLLFAPESVDGYLAERAS